MTAMEFYYYRFYKEAFMFRILLTLIFILCSSLSLASEENNLLSKQISNNNSHITKYQRYFDKLELPYAQPDGCSEDMRCSLLSDFNGDGEPDFSGLYEYTGSKKRRNNWNLDLVILYSADNSIKHVIFTHVGQINESKGIINYLEEQNPGIMELIPGSKTSRELKLDTPAINIKRKSTSGYFPTFYWDGKKFIAASKADD